jgi:hypothetical protein
MSEAQIPEFSGQQPFTRRTSQISAGRRHQLVNFLLEYLQDDSADIRKTHWFNGRFENIYLKRDCHPVLAEVIDEALQLAASVLGIPKDKLAIGFWLNLMPPGHTTTLHTHDDMDERLSAVFYLEAPSSSGNLQLKVDNQLLEVEPVEGDFLFFSPRLAHAVSENLSEKPRLSIGMNFGPRAESLNPR